MKLYQRGVTSSEPLERLPAKDGVTYAVGMALKLSEGKAAPAGVTEKPAYLCAGVEKDGWLPVIRIQPDMIFSAPLSEAGTPLKIGDLVTLSGDAMGVTATTTAGVAEITGFDTENRAAGDTAYIKF